MKVRGSAEPGRRRSGFTAVLNVTLAWTSATLQIGGTGQLTARTKDAGGRVLADPTVMNPSRFPPKAAFPPAGSWPYPPRAGAYVVATGAANSGQAALGVRTRNARATRNTISHSRPAGPQQQTFDSP